MFTILCTRPRYVPARSRSHLPIKGQIWVQYFCILSTSFSPIGLFLHRCMNVAYFVLQTSLVMLHCRSGICSSVVDTLSWWWVCSLCILASSTMTSSPSLSTYLDPPGTLITRLYTLVTHTLCGLVFKNHVQCRHHPALSYVRTLYKSKSNSFSSTFYTCM